MENKSESEVQLTVIIIQIPFPMGNGKTELGSIFCGHNIFNPCSIFYRGGFNISLQNIEPGFRMLQNILNLSSILGYQNII